jgi:tetratricopeptide (TPR) repeat protein
LRKLQLLSAFVFILIVVLQCADTSMAYAFTPQQIPESDTEVIKQKKVKDKPVRYIDKDIVVEQKQLKSKDSTAVKKKKTTTNNEGGFTSVTYFEHQDTLVKKTKSPKQKIKQDTSSVQHQTSVTDTAPKTSKRDKKKSEITTHTISNQTEPDTTSNDFKIIKQDGFQVTVSTKKEKKLNTDTLYEQKNKPQYTYQSQPVTYTREQIAAMLLDTGNYYLERGRFLRAQLYFDSLTNYYQNTFQFKFGYYFKAKCKMGLKDAAGAVNDFNYFLLLDGCKSNFCTDTHYNIGVLKFQLGQIEQALNEFEIAVKDTAYKNYKFIFYYRGFCYAQQEDYIRAIQDLTRFLNMDNGRTYSTAEATYYRGFYKTQLQDYRGAIKDYDAAIEMYLPSATGKTPNQQHIQKLIEVYIVRGLAKSQLKKYDESIADYNLVLKLNPKNATAFRLRALDYIKKGEVEQGCLDLSRAGELGSNEAYNDIKQYCK